MSYSHASILAFLYAGAVAADDELRRKAQAVRAPLPEHFEDWEGHRGFVHYAEPLAQQIADHLNSPQFAEALHDGVVEYELIEPLGGWLLTHQTETDTAFDKFKTDYAEWIKTTERTIETEHYTINLDLHGEHRGYFEHKVYGDERAGGLWYDENKNLTDYDGVTELPKEVREALKADGFTSTEGCLDD